MPYGLLVHVVVFFHVMFIVFAVAGGFLLLKWRWLCWVHVPAVIWAVLVELTGGVCPLTPLEFWLRNKAGLAGYDSGFIDHYLWPLIYPEELTRAHQYALGIFVLVLNIILYAWLWRRQRTR